MESKTIDKKYFFILMAIAYIFAVAVRFIWVEQFSHVSQFFWNGQLMINTNDGYAFAEGARDMIAGFHQKNDLSYVDSSVSTLTYILYKLFHIKFETLILWMPSFLGSLLVIPIMLIARSLKQDMVGFPAALLGAIVWSYYNRTMTGYYDTDMLIIVLASFTLWGLIANLNEQKDEYLFLIPLFIITSLWWYSQSYTLTIGFIAMVFLYTLIFDRKNLFNYKVLIFMLISVASIAWWIKIALFIALYLLFRYKKEVTDKKTIFFILFLSFLLVLFTGGFEPIIQNIKVYLLRETYTGDSEKNIQLHYYAVNKTVREAGKIPFEIFADRISGSVVVFILSVIGYALFAFKFRVLLLALPMVAMGFMALKGGLRFTVYAVPPMALGISYLIFFIAELFKNFINDKKKLIAAKTAFVSLCTVLIIYPNIIHIIGYKVPTVFSRSEVAILDKLKHIAGREDYVVTWWDYGYPIRYYSDVKTLIDGGKHTGKSNFPVSFILTKDQISAANMSRLDVEYTEKGFKKHFDSNLLQEMKDYNFTDINDFLYALSSKDFKLPKKTRDIYLYLPERMMNIFPTVALFSNLDLSTGKELPRHFFYMSSRYSDKGNYIVLGRNMLIIKNKGEIRISQRVFKINRFIVTAYGKKKRLMKTVRVIDPNSPINVIYLRSYHKFLIVDNDMYNSTYIQLFVLENYDKSLYEPVILSPYAKVYRLKR